MMTSSEDNERQAGVRVVTLQLPEDEGEGLGFTITRTMWDPYPWVREVAAGGRAAAAGVRCGDCLLQADGKDLLGLPVGRVAAAVRGDSGGHSVALVLWSCGASPQDDPELLWSAGGGARGERSRRALAGVLRALACCVCSATAGSPQTRAAQCARGHLYCAGCRSRLQRCALCRDSLPALDTPQSRNLVAEQVFESIATVYELKDQARVLTTASASSSPIRSPLSTPKSSLSLKNSPSSLRKTVQFGLTNQLHHGSDISLNRPKPSPEFVFRRTFKQDAGSQTDLAKSSSEVEDNSQKLRRNSRSHSVDLSTQRDDLENLARDSQSNSGQHCENIPQKSCQMPVIQQTLDSHCKCCHSSKICDSKNRIQSNFCGCSNTPEPRADIRFCMNSQVGYQRVYGVGSFSSIEHKNVEAKSCCQNNFCARENNCLTTPPCNNSPKSADTSRCAAACGLQHRLVARLRPASSLADLRFTSTAIPHQCGPGERTVSVSDMATQQSIDEPILLMAPPSPVLVWAYHQ